MTATQTGILSAALVVSLVHGILPNHWAPFVLIGRSQEWSLRRTLRVLVMAGAAHMAVSGAFAMVLMLVGVAAAGSLQEWAERLPGAILVVAGLAYVVLDLASGPGHHHHHHDVHDAASAGMSDKAAVTTLILTLALSPCEAMLPVFAGAAPLGDPTFLLGLVVLSGSVSLVLMAVLAGLAWGGARRLDFGRFAQHERLLMGAVLALIGAYTLIVGH